MCSAHTFFPAAKKKRKFGNLMGTRRPMILRNRKYSLTRETRNENHFNWVDDILNILNRFLCYIYLYDIQSLQFRRFRGSCWIVDIITNIQRERERRAEFAADRPQWNIGPGARHAGRLPFVCVCCWLLLPTASDGISLGRLIELWIASAIQKSRETHEKLWIWPEASELSYNRKRGARWSVT